MGRSRKSSVTYQGEILISEFDVQRLHELESELSDFLDIEPGEDLYVSMPNDGQIEVRKLSRQD